MKLCIISDTHGQQHKLEALSGDVLIHCGDMFNMFNQSDDDFDQMDDWFGQQNFELILCIGGNHDFELQKRASYVEQPFKNAVYLEGTSYEFNGVTFYGAPWVPDLFGQAYFIKDHQLPEKWASIPNNIDVLITHTPALGILDVSSTGLSLGCRHLLTELERIKPSVHCFGHIHNSSGVYNADTTTSVNAALANSQHQVCRAPYELNLKL